MNDRAAADAVSDTAPDRNRERAWIYLRRVVEASSQDVLCHLWPDGDSSAPADVERLAGMLRKADPALPASLRSTTSKRREIDPVDDETWALRNGWRLITPDTPEWPTQILDQAFMFLDADIAVDGVRGQAARPFALWARGQGRLWPLVERSAAMVGTRSATTYGQQVTQEMAGELATAGITVVSGGAVGIDTAAHRGALNAGGSTVVVMANGPGMVYPKANAQLFAATMRSGLVVTEYPPLQRPARHRFLTRNRLVAAMTVGTVLLAAGYRSGAVNTCNWADQMLKPVMVLPGPVTSADYIGCHKRIRDGSGILVTRALDVREVIEPLGAVDSDQQLSLEFAPSPVQQLTQQQLRVYDCCGMPGDSLGELQAISTDTGMPLSDVVRLIGELEQLGLAHRDGARWVKATD
jgi:DNA processing protein